MNALASLATTALLGTERRPPEWPAPEGPLGELLARIPRDQTEKALLQTAGVLATCHGAGWLPEVISEKPEPASMEEVLNHDAESSLKHALSSILEDGPVRLQAEAFRCLAGSGRGIPFRFLPKALDAGKRSAALRSALLPVLGRRGTWLAGQNDSWAYAAGAGGDMLDEDVWQHGSLAFRQLYLTALRMKDATRARELAAGALTSEGARERAAFIECLAASLSIADEDLLEGVLLDKSKEARQAAMRLLSSLPESRFMQRMIARAQPCVMMEKKFLRGTTLTVEAPKAYDSDWKNDLIEEAKPKGHPFGERAWWLFQIVRAVPLAWWETHTSMKPAALIEAAQNSDWKDALLQGWAAAQALQKRPEWAEAFLSTRIPAGAALNSLDLLETLPLPMREKQFLRLFSVADTSQGYAGSALLERFLNSISFDSAPLSADTARSLIQLLKHRIHSGGARVDWQLRAPLVELACVLPEALFEEYAKGWDLAKEEVQLFADAITRIGIVLDLRRQILSLKP